MENIIQFLILWASLFLIYCVSSVGILWILEAPMTRKQWFGVVLITAMASLYVAVDTFSKQQ